MCRGVIAHGVPALRGFAKEFRAPDGKPSDNEKSCAHLKAIQQIQ
jgi:hypothetical protein